MLDFVLKIILGEERFKRYSKLKELVKKERKNIQKIVENVFNESKCLYRDVVVVAVFPGDLVIEVYDFICESSVEEKIKKVVEETFPEVTSVARKVKVVCLS